MNVGDVVSRGAFPEVFSWLLFCPGGYRLQVMIVVAGIPNIRVDLPEVFDLRSQEGEKLQWLGHMPRWRGFGPRVRSVSKPMAKRLGLTHAVQLLDTTSPVIVC